MGRILKYVNVSSEPSADNEIEYLFTAAELADLLLQLKELRKYHITVTEIPDYILQLTIGDSIYHITNKPVHRF
jgi:hypothetical protein